MTMVFENTVTMRWQVQEMARVERMLRDEQIAHEVETYNQLIPDAGELSATLMIELTSEPALREWLPRLVGIERAHRDRPARRHSVFGELSDEDELRLTRDDITAAVHFLKFRFAPDDIEMFASGPVHIVVDHPEYDQDVVLDAGTARATARPTCRGDAASLVRPMQHPRSPPRSRCPAARRGNTRATRATT